MAQIYQSTQEIFSLVLQEKLKCQGFVKEKYALRKLSLKGKCLRVNAEYCKVCYEINSVTQGEKGERMKERDNPW